MIYLRRKKSPKILLIYPLNATRRVPILRIASACMWNITQVCIPRQYGHCRIGWRQAADRDSFKLSRGAASYNGAAGPGSSNCDPDAAIIIGNDQTYCSTAL